MSYAKSTSLFHFTKNLETLQSILANGFYPRLSVEDVSWTGIPGLEFVAFPMVCFCDIPLGRIEDHVDFYGEYGLGMSKEWALKNGLNPVFYVSSSAPVGKSIVEAIQAAVRDDEADADKSEYSTDHLHFMWAHAKPIFGKMVVGEKPVSKDFYVESEWRHIPILDTLRRAVSMDTYEDETWKKKQNERLQAEAVLKFNPEDIRYLFVPRDSDIPLLVDFINSQLASFPLVDLKILLTRITSLEHVRKDI